MNFARRPLISRISDVADRHTRRVADTALLARRRTRTRGERQTVATDRELLSRFRQGERAAFTAIVRRHYPHVTRQAMALLEDPDDARDVVQETFIAVWKKASTIELVGDSIGPWLSATAWHIAQNRLRTASRRPVASDEELELHLRHQESRTGDPTEELGEYRFLLDRIARAVAAMPSIDRQLYRLCIREGLGYEAAAIELGVHKTVVRNRVSRIRTRLRDRFLADR